MASQNGQVEIVDMLLATQAAVNAANDEGCTALYRASFRGHHVIVQRLLASGADIHAESETERQVRLCGEITRVDVSLKRAGLGTTPSWFPRGGRR